MVARGITRARLDPSAATPELPQSGVSVFCSSIPVLGDWFLMHGTAPKYHPQRIRGRPSSSPVSSIMPLTISDNLLNQAGMTPEKARVEIACLLFASGKLTLPAATRWAEMSRSGFEGELLSRSIPLYQPRSEDLDRELEVLAQRE